MKQLATGAASPAAEQRNFFSLFELSPSPDIDSVDLATRKRKLLVRFHPDQFAAATPAERKLAEGIAAEINAGFLALHDPVKRAGYLLSLNGVSLADAERKPVDGAFLMQQIELREALSESRAMDASTLRSLSTQVQALFDQEWQGFREAWQAGNIDCAIDGWVRLQYADKLRRELDEHRQD